LLAFIHSESQWLELMKIFFRDKTKRRLAKPPTADAVRAAATPELNEMADLDGLGRAPYFLNYHTLQRASAIPPERGAAWEAMADQSDDPTSQMGR
jgi:hypothetical protein